MPSRAFMEKADREVMRTKVHRGDLLLLVAAVPVAMLVVSATFPPGTLWETEARGYDVMEYHLQLPREYTESGSAMPVRHNVYSYFPANVEMVYVLLMQLGRAVMQDDSYLWGTYPAQFFHVVLMLLTAATLALAPMGRAGAKRQGGGTGGGNGLTGATGRAAAVLLFLGVPWTVVTGSLAYNEGGMLFFGTVALVLALGGGGGGSAAKPGEESAGSRAGPPVPPAVARGVLIGVFLGLAVGSKLTAGLFFALPVAVVLLLRAVNQGAMLKTLVVAAGVALAVFLPWGVRAAVASGGNPVFPFFTSVLGRDGWTGEEVARFEKGHAAPEGARSVGGRMKALVENSVLDAQWSPGWASIDRWSRNPLPPESWTRVGLLWVIVPLGLALAFGAMATRPMAALLLVVLGVQVVVWMLFTHLAARFLLPISIPLGLLMMFAAQGRGHGEPLLVGGLRVAVATGLGVHALCTIFLLLPERGLLGGTAAREGSLTPPPPTPPLPQPIGSLFEQQLNVALWGRPELLRGPLDPSRIPPPETVLLVGEARAWRYEGRADQVRYSSVFDRNLLSEVMAVADGKERLALLQREGIQWVLVHWPEVERLRRTYGFDEAITPEAVKGLAEAGLREVPLEDGWVTLLRVPD